LRTAEGFGVGRVCIIPNEKKPKLSMNTSSGATKWLQVEYFDSVKECISELKVGGFKVFGALVDPEAEVLWNQDFSGKVAVLVGNEAQGMSEESKELVDQNIYIPMFGLTESLNVSVAAGMFLYEVIRQKEADLAN
jgi:tRNA (guanosine-2'-O-)-methyltransferase